MAGRTSDVFAIPRSSLSDERMLISRVRATARASSSRLQLWGALTVVVVVVALCWLGFSALLARWQML